MLLIKRTLIKLYGLLSLALLASVALFWLVTPVMSQKPTNPKPSSGRPSIDEPTSQPTSISLSNIVIRADSDAKKLENIRSETIKNPAISSIEQAIPKFSKELDARVLETQGILSARPSLETLRSLEEDWQAFAKSIVSWKSDVKTRSDDFNNKFDELKRLKNLWQQTLINTTKLSTTNPQTEVNEDIETDNKVSNVVEIPPEVIDKIEFVIDEINKTQKAVEEQRAELLTLQTRISGQAEKIDNQLGLVKQAHESALSNLFVSDQPPIWRVGERVSSSSAVMEETQSSFAMQAAALTDYANRRSERFLLHGGVFILLFIALLWMRYRITKWVDKDSKLKRAMVVFKFPVMTALLFSLLLSDLFYPQSPRMLSTLLQVAALIPSIVLLRHLIPKPLFPLLYTLSGLYLISRIMELCASLQFVTRLLFLFEMLVAIGFSIWFLFSIRRIKEPELRQLGIFKVSNNIIPPIIVAFSIAFAANVVGFVSLSRLIGNGILDSAIIALIFYAGLNVAESLLTFAVRARPLSRLEMIKTHRRKIQDQILRLLRLFAVIAWMIVTLNILSLRDRVWSLVSEFLTKELVTSAFSFSLGDILGFGLTVWLAFFVSRILRFILEKDIYARIHFSGGVAYAISTMLHYFILLLGFVMAIATLGVDMSRFTILAGAFGVGLGFGLQNIVNNFVSGLILLFERPVKVGDILEVDNQQGELTQIGLRASTIRSRDGSDVILPNGQFISERVINWTHGDKCRRLEIKVGVGYDSDPEQVLELLTKVAITNPEVLEEPEPNAVFMGFGENSLDFELRAWTNIADRWRQVYSAVAIDVHKALKEAQINIPLPQRDLHLKSAEKSLIEDVIKK